MKTKLQIAIQAANKKYELGLNDDDEIRNMIEIDKKTKGHSFIIDNEDYQICTDEEKLQHLIGKYGYWSDQVKNFNHTLTEKGGHNYMTKLNLKLK